MSEEDVINAIKKSLSLNITTSDYYVGGMDSSGSLYKDSQTIQLLFDGEVISEATID